MKQTHIRCLASIFNNECIIPSFQFHTIVLKWSKISIYFQTVTGDIQEAIILFNTFFLLKLQKIQKENSKL